MEGGKSNSSGMALAVSPLEGGKNAVIKGSFPFVMQTYDRPTLTPPPSVTSGEGRKRQEKAKGEEGSRLPLSGVEYVERERGTKERTMK